MSNSLFDLSDDVIDVRDIIERVEELAEDLTNYTAEANTHPEMVGEHTRLLAILDDLKGNGGDEQWEGDWYPIILIRDSHFRDYAQELAEECGTINPNANWPLNCIDWDQAARELQHDYSAVYINGITYWYR